MTSNARKLAGALAFASALVAGPVFAGEAAQASGESFDYDKINAAIATALSAKDFNRPDGVESFLYSIEPKGTDIALDQYLFQVDLKLSQVPWSKGGLDASGKFGFKADLSDAKDRSVMFTYDATYKTDAVAMLKHKAIEMSHCEGREKRSGLLEVLWSRHCEYVERLPGVSSVVELRSLLTEKLAAHKQDVADYISAIENSLKLVDDPAAGVLRAQVAMAKGVQLLLGRIAIKDTKTGFELDTPAITGCPIFGSSGMHLDVSPDVLLAKGDVQLKFGKPLYAATKPAIVDVLRGLERGDDYATNIVQLDAGVFMNLIVNALNNSSEQQQP